MKLNRLKALVIKELLAVWSDKKTRMTLIMPPLMMLVLFANSATLEVTHANLGIWNRDHGAESRTLLHRVRGVRAFETLRFFQSEQQIREAMDTQQVLTVMIIPPDFTRRILSKQPVQVQIIADGRHSNSSQIVQGYLSQILTRYNRDLTLRFTGLPRPASEIIPRNWFNPNLDYVWFTLPGLVAILTLTVTLTVTAQSIARERELGTFDQLLVSPLEPWEILTGKTIPALIIGVGEGSLMILATIFIYHLPFRGSLPLLYLAMFTFMLAITGIGLFISSLSKTQQQAVLGTFIFNIPANTLSGYAAPIENMPDWLQPVTYLNPMRYFMVVLRGVYLKDMSAATILSNVWPMALIAVFTLGGAAWFFKRRLQ